MAMGSTVGTICSFVLFRRAQPSRHLWWRCRNYTSFLWKWKPCNCVVQRVRVVQQYLFSIFFFHLNTIIFLAKLKVFQDFHSLNIIFKKIKDLDPDPEKFDRSKILPSIFPHHSFFHSLVSVAVLLYFPSVNCSLLPIITIECRAVHMVLSQEAWCFIQLK